MELNQMMTFMFRQYHPARLPEAAVCIIDIAAHLAQIARFGGACPVRWTVADHAAHVVRLVMQSHPDIARLALLALMHDAHEAYGAGDVPTPFKRLLYVRVDGVLLAYTDWEESTQAAILRALEIEPPTPEEAAVIAAADWQAFVDEAYEFFDGVPGEDRSGCAVTSGVGTHEFERMFARFFELARIQAVGAQLTGGDA